MDYFVIVGYDFDKQSEYIDVSEVTLGVIQGKLTLRLFILQWFNRIVCFGLNEHPWLLQKRFQEGLQVQGRFFKGSLRLIGQTVHTLME